MVLLRAPLLLLRWVAVFVAAAIWLVVVPLVDLWRSLVGRLRRG